ncbi:MAG: hypothetical protein ACXVY6_13020 [Gaiellaceae bacterium]
MAKRGFFAELQYQSAQADKRRRQAETAAERHRVAAQREYERAQRAAEKAEAQERRAEAAGAKAAERDAKLAYVESRQAEVAALNAELTSAYSDIDSILQWTLDFDDYVDLQALRQAVEHPPFPHADLESPLPPPVPIQAPPEPSYVEPPPPKGLFGKKRHAEAVAQAQADFTAAREAWQVEAAKVPTLQFEQMQRHSQAEEQRSADLAAARAAYDEECRAREHTVQVHNDRLDRFIADLAANDPAAVQEYVSLVISNSVYPEVFPVSHEFEFNAPDRELTLNIKVPAPAEMPTVKEHKYSKSKDEITQTSLTLKDQKERYTSAICQTAVRSLHEIFEADRDGRISTISLTLGADSIDAGTGRPITTPLVAVAAHRDTFVEFDLANVVPAATIERLNGVVSKNPFGLTPIATGPSVRG